MNTNTLKKISTTLIASVAIAALTLAIVPSIAEAKVTKTVKKYTKVAAGYVTPGYTVPGYTVPGYKGIKLVPKKTAGYTAPGYKTTKTYRPSR